MIYLRKVQGKTKIDRIRNQTVRPGLGVAPLANTIETKQLQWFGHLERMEIHRIPKNGLVSKNSREETKRKTETYVGRWN